MTPARRSDPVFSEQAWMAIGRSLRLSPRELQITRHVFNDSSDRSMALALGLSRHTIHTYVERLYDKLAVTSRVGLVVRVVRQFLALTTETGSSLPPICARNASRGCPLDR